MAKKRITEKEPVNTSKEIKVSMFVDSALLEKIKAIAEQKGNRPKEEIHKALVDYVDHFEGNNFVKVPNHKSK